MHRAGHYGAALLAYAPVGVVLVAADLSGLAILGGVASAGLAMLPDWDQRIPGITHRGVTHSVHFAGVVGAVLAIVGALLGSSTGPIATVGLGVLGFYVGASTVLSHILADALTPMGVEPFPDGRHYTYDVARADSLLANYALLGLGGMAAAGAFLVGSAIAAVV